MLVFDASRWWLFSLKMRLAHRRGVKTPFPRSPRKWRPPSIRLGCFWGSVSIEVSPRIVQGVSRSQAQFRHGFGGRWEMKPAPRSKPEWCTKSDPDRPHVFSGPLGLPWAPPGRPIRDFIALPASPGSKTRDVPIYVFTFSAPCGSRIILFP